MWRAGVIRWFSQASDRRARLDMNLDDPRLTPLFRRLATVLCGSFKPERTRSPSRSSRARISVDVDSGGVTWFPFSVNSDATHDEARACLSAALAQDVQRWIDQLEPGERKARDLVSGLIVGITGAPRGCGDF